VDGAEQLTRLQWFRLRLRRGGLVVTTHRRGMLPELHECRTSPALLREIASSLGVELTEDECSALHRRHAGNIRESLRELYDRGTSPG
jgi:DNA polymerase III delta prime subunit